MNMTDTITTQNFQDQLDALQYPNKNDFYDYEVYQKGKIIQKKKMNQQDFEDFMRGQSIHALNDAGYIVQKILDHVHYQEQVILYQVKVSMIIDQFTQYLFKKFHLEEYSKRDLIFSKAYEHGYASGLSEVEYWFSEFAEVLE